MDDLLEYFIKEPEREFHVRELASIARKAPTTISKYLNNYVKNGYLTSERKLSHLFFRANTESKLFKVLKIYRNIALLRNSGLIDYLIEEFNQPQAVILFGSFAKGENIPRSDVDILVITPVKKNIDLSEFERKLKHKIELFLTSKEEIEKMKTVNKNLLNNWINGAVLEGYWELF